MPMVRTIDQTEMTAEADLLSSSKKYVVNRAVCRFKCKSAWFCEPGVVEGEYGVFFASSGQWLVSYSLPFQLKLVH